MNDVELFGRVGCVDSVMPAGKCLRVITFHRLKQRKIDPIITSQIDESDVDNRYSLPASIML